jgi:hypothetical protein
MQTYKIVSFNKDTGSIAVEFAPDMAPAYIDLPIKDDGTYPVGTELDEYVQGFIPTWFLERKVKIAQGIANEAAIQALVVEPTPPKSFEMPDNAIETDLALKMWSDVQAEQQFAKMAIKFGLLTEDPTKIGVTQL